MCTTWCAVSEETPFMVRSSACHMADARWRCRPRGAAQAGPEFVPTSTVRSVVSNDRLYMLARCRTRRTMLCCRQRARLATTLFGPHQMCCDLGTVSSRSPSHMPLDTVRRPAARRPGHLGVGLACTGRRRAEQESRPTRPRRGCVHGAASRENVSAGVHWS